MATQGDLQHLIEEATANAIADTGPLNTPTTVPTGDEAQIPNGAGPVTETAQAVNVVLQPHHQFLHLLSYRRKFKLPYSTAL